MMQSSGQAVFKNKKWTPDIMEESRQKAFMITRDKILVILLMVFCWGCETSDPGNQIPPAIVNETINLTNQQYQNLQFIGGYVEIAGGVRGIIIYHEGNNEFCAFERNCSYQPLDACAQVGVESSGLFMVDSCCSSTFNFDGFPTGGPATLPLRTYQALKNGDFLTITN